MEVIKQGNNIKQAGEDYLQGNQILGHGSVITPGDICLLAAYGKASIDVFRKPRVAVLCLSRHVIPWQSIPEPGQIRDSNGPLLSMLIMQDGGIPTVSQAAGLSDASLLAVAGEYLEQADVLIIIGGTFAEGGHKAHLLMEEVSIGGEQRNRYTQSSIIEKLTDHMHKNKEKKKHLAIILTVIEGEALNDTLLEEFRIILTRSLRSDRDWIGHYIGNVFFITLDDIDETAANMIKNRINLNIRITIEKMKLGNEIKVRFAVKTISNDITDPGAAIRMAFMALYSQIAV
jgi:GGDEF domain-containing protein